MDYTQPEVVDLGDLVQITQAGELLGEEDAGAKFSFLDVSDGVLP
jgi:hypothetical protein